MNWDLRRPERWRGRVRGQVPAWSALPVAAVVIIVSGIFWGSMWALTRPPSSTVTIASVRAKDPGVQAPDDRAGLNRTIPDVADEPIMPSGPIVIEQSIDIESITASPYDESDELAGPVDSSSPAEAGYASEISQAQVAEIATPAGDTAAPATARAGEITAKAEELTTRAEELTARNEELATKIGELTTKVEELATKLEASAASIAARPAAVPSPVVAQQRPSVTANARALPATSGTRPPLVVLPQPEPGSRVTAGPLVLETRARGEAPITQIRLVLDGVDLPVALERRDDSTWRGRASTRVNPGQHTVAVAVVDGKGQVGTYRWQFDAAPS